MPKAKLVERFLKKHVTAGNTYKASSLYDAFIAEEGTDIVTQKNFAMYLRLQVVRSNGILKRSAHGVYELRTDPNDKGVSFARQDRLIDIPSLEEDDLITQIGEYEQPKDLRELFDDVIIVSSQLINVARTMEMRHRTRHDISELQQIRKCMVKELDELITSTSALVAWEDEHPTIVRADIKERMDMSIQEVNRIKNHYPPGTRIELISMNDPYDPVPSGTRGTVEDVDDDGQLHMKWDNGRTLAAVPGVDSFRKLTPEEIEAEKPTEDISEDNPISM